MCAGRVTPSTLFVAVLLVSVPLLAQTTGSIQGRIESSQGEPLPGVTVTATSPRLPGEQQVVTDAAGRFRILALPPGEYRLTVKIDGFNPLEVDSLRVGLDRTVSVELTMSSAFGEQITVTEGAPPIDMTGTTTGAEFSEELFSQLPTSRSFQDLAFFAPGTTDGGIEGNASIRGSSAVENRYVVEGLDVTDAAYGWLATELPMEFIQELEVKTGAYGPEYGGALGGVLNVITKSGGNELRGDVFAYYNNTDLQASSPSTLEFGTFEGLTKYDYGFDVGGKIIRDKLWYFVALNPQSETQEVRNRQDLPIEVDRSGLAYAGKLTWAPNPRHRLTGSVFGDPIDQSDVYEFVGGSFNTLNSAGRILHDWDQETFNAVARYSWTVGPRQLLEASLGRYTQDHLWAPTSEEEPWYIDITGDGSWARRQRCGDPSLVSSGDIWFVGDCEGGVLRDELDRSRDQATVEYSHFLGSHEIETGLVLRDVASDWSIREAAPFRQPLVDQWGTVVNPEGTPGALFVLLPATEGVYVMSEDIGDVNATTRERAWYLQDRWQPMSSLTLNLGLRIETVEADGGVPGVGLDFGAGEMLAPRLGATWDFTGTGRARLYGHGGRFYESVPQILNILGLGNAYINDYFFLYPTDGSLPSYTNLGTFLGGTSGGQNAVDSQIDPPYTDEYVLGIEGRLLGQWTAGVAAIYREAGNVMEDVFIEPSRGSYLTNPERPVTVDPFTGEPLDKPLVFPEPVREYRALELTARRPLAEGWQVFGSYVYSKTEGNYEGLNRQDGFWEFHSHVTSAFDTPELTRGSFGPLPNDRRHQLKVQGSYRFDLGLSLGAYGRFATGRPISRYGLDDKFFEPYRFIGQRGSAGRTDDLWAIDLHLAYPIELGSRYRLTVIGDLFNATNQQGAVSVDQVWSFAPRPATDDPQECGGPGTGFSTDCPFGNPNWGEPTRFQRPRSLRLGIRFSW